MEASGAVKDAPVIRELLDEALGTRRQKALGITDSQEPPGQGTEETLHTIQTLLLRLIKWGETLSCGQNIGLGLLRENLIEARAGREVSFEELVEKPWMAKGKTKELFRSRRFWVTQRSRCRHGTHMQLAMDFVARWSL